MIATGTSAFVYDIRLRDGGGLEFLAELRRDDELAFSTRGAARRLAPA